MADETSRRVEDLADAIRGQGRVMAQMLGSQKVLVEMTAEVLRAVTKRPDDGEDSIGQLLRQVVAGIEANAGKLDLIIERVYGPD